MPRIGKHTRRDLFKRITIGCVGKSCLLDFIASCGAVEAIPSPIRSVVVLWLEGGPATIDLWDLKPGHENGGPFREIQTSVPGLMICENLPGLATWAEELAVIRSIKSKEGDHNRATHYVKTGYLSQGAVRFPALGSLLAHELSGELEEFPPFVSIAPGDRTPESLGGGFLGSRYSPLRIARQGSMISDLQVANLRRPEDVSSAQQSQRLQFLHDMESQFHLAYGAQAAPLFNSRRVALRQAVQMMSPQIAEVFDIAKERDADRDRYGRNLFGQSCLLARRLVERGVRVVEATLGGWDTHSNNFELTKDLSATLDRAWSALFEDLQRRGLLASTLIVCLGEFGRTPKINGNLGRDHWPNSWSAVLAGGGIRGGQAVGATSPDGMMVTERPVTVPDLIATICSKAGIDPQKQNLSNVGRPIRVADPAAQVIGEVL